MNRFKQDNTTRDFSNHRFNRWCNKLSIGSLTTIKGDVKDGLTVHVHLRPGCKTPMGCAGEYCATFYLTNSLDLIFNGRYRKKDLCVRLVKLNPEFFNNRIDSNNSDKSMFIGVINVSEKGECFLPCLVRLQTLDCCPLNISQASDSIFPDVPGTLTFEKTFTVPDGELDVLIEGGAFEQPELPEQMVEGRPEVVTNIANEQGQVNRKIFNLLELENMVGCLSLIYNLRDDFIGLTISEPLCQVIISSEVILCSAEFEKRAIERMHMLYYP